MKSKKFFEVSKLLERYNNLKEPYQMVLFFVPFTIIVFAVFLGLISRIPGGFTAPGFYDSIALNRVLEKTVVTDQTTNIKNVDTIVADINSGKTATDFKSTDFSPFCSMISPILCFAYFSKHQGPQTHLCNTHPLRFARQNLWRWERRRLKL